MRTRREFFAMFLAMWMMGGWALADCGSIPFWAPVKQTLTNPFDLTKIDPDLLDGLPEGTKEVRFDPLDVVVYEPGQRAIVLWNGDEEELLLSTEIRTSDPVSILEVIPFPNEPSVSLGDFESFQKMQALMIQKEMWKVTSGGGATAEIPEGVARITFRQKMGAHDLAVVEVQEPGQFSRWIEAYLSAVGATRAQIEPEFLDVVQRYVDRGFRWFVLDSIDTSDALQSREPVRYRFATDSLYYPLEISTLEHGKTLVDLVCVTSEPLAHIPEVTGDIDKGKVLSFTAKELASVDASWPAFFGDEAVSVQRIELSGTLDSMQTDFIAY